MQPLDSIADDSGEVSSQFFAVVWLHVNHRKWLIDRWRSWPTMMFQWDWMRWHALCQRPIWMFWLVHCANVPISSILRPMWQTYCRFDDGWCRSVWFGSAVWWLVIRWLHSAHPAANFSTILWFYHRHTTETVYRRADDLVDSKCREHSPRVRQMRADNSALSNPIHEFHHRMHHSSMTTSWAGL